MPSIPCTTRPQSLDELQDRARALSGFTLAELADRAGLSVPKDLKREKGWMGLLLEHFLGAQAGSRPEPDFPELGVELKTLPIDRQGRPLESTFVAVAPYEGWQGVQWQGSHVRAKLARVLWIPILAERSLAPAERLIATPMLHSLQPDEEAILRRDWEELVELLALGRFDEISAHKGQYLQLRPKAANGRVKTLARNSEGELVAVQPKGFYLRSLYTSRLLSQHFGLA
ncbi:DNA mismatch repair endonuclease MutH [Gallaecimonas sp. GXIMD4217]|uniref:DNA mismatch repair endonuclease MutH n=1 Tax=Gallaecimonas sp. GXIMD4217 TaxID=3131927 RepID=UPI00311ABCB5